MVDCGRGLVREEEEEEEEDEGLFVVIWFVCCVVKSDCFFLVLFCLLRKEINIISKPKAFSLCLSSGD